GRTHESCREQIVVAPDHADGGPELMGCNTEEMALQARDLLEISHVRTLVLAHHVEAGRQVAHLVTAVHLERVIVIPTLHLLGPAHKLSNRRSNPLGDHQPREQRDDCAENPQLHQPRLNLAEKGGLGVERTLHRVVAPAAGTGIWQPIEKGEAYLALGPDLDDPSAAGQPVALRPEDS